MGCIKEADSSDHNATIESDAQLAQKNQDETGDPVNVVTGAFVLSETDLSIPSQRLVIKLTRNYNNQHHDLDKKVSPFGYGWTHSFNLYLEPGPSPFQITYTDDRGTEINFEFVIPEEFHLFYADYELVYSNDSDIRINYKKKSIGFFDNKGNQICDENRKTSNDLQLKVGSDFGQIILSDNDQILATFKLPVQTLKISPPPGALGMEMVFGENGRINLTQIDGLTAIFRPDGKIESLTKPGPITDSKIILQYDDSDRLSRISGVGGRYIEFFYFDGLITEVKDTTGRKWNYLYNKNHELIEVSDPENRVRRYGYRGWEGRVSIGKGKTESRKIRSIEKIFPYTTKGSSENIKAELTLKYTSDRRVVQHTDALGNNTRFNYNRFTKITTVVDPLGYTTLYCFDQIGNTSKVRHPRGGTTEYIYDKKGNLLAEIDPIGNTTKYVEFKDLNRIDHEKDFGKRIFGNRSDYVSINQDEISIGYDEKGNRPCYIDALGNTTRFFNYSIHGKPRNIILPNGAQIHYDYDDRCGLPTRMERIICIGRPTPLLIVQEWKYDAIGNLIRQTDWAQESGEVHPKKRIKEFEYDDFGQPIVSLEWIEEKGNGRYFATEVNYKWDELGNLVERTDLVRESPRELPKLLSTKYGYDQLGRDIWQIDQENIGHFMKYDLAGRLIEKYLVPNVVSNPLSEIPERERKKRTRWEYDVMGHELAFIGPDGATSRTEWDQNGRKKSVSDPLKMVTKYQYDQDGNLTLESFPGGYKIAREYDLAGRITRQSDNLGRVVLKTYDPLGRLHTITNKINSQDSITTYSYDVLNHLDKVVYPDNTNTSFEVDERGKVVTRSRGNETNPHFFVEKTTYDIFNRRTSVLVGTPDSMSKQFTIKYNDTVREIQIIDALGNQSSIFFNSQLLPIRNVTAEGRSLIFEIDGKMRIRRQFSDDRQVDTSFDYDYSNRLISATESQIDYRWQYDNAGRVIQHLQSVGQESQSIHYVYDTGGRLIHKKINDDWWMDFDYAPDTPYLTNIEIPGASIALETNLLGHVTKETWSSGDFTQYKYSVDGDLNTIESYDPEKRLVFSQVLDRDLRGRPIREKRTRLTSDDNYRYQYDQLDRLIQIDAVDNQGSKQEYRRYLYDRYGNRLEEYRLGKLYSTYLYDAANRLIERKQSSGITERNIYDRCGNLVSNGNLTFSYDANQRLRRITQHDKSDGFIDYSYSATDQRVIINRQGEKEIVYYDGGQQVKSEQGQKKLLSYWGVKTDSLLALNESRGLKHAYTDIIGSVVALGSITNFAEYDPFGERVAGPQLPFGYCGKKFDAETGFYHGRARQYDPLSGQFIQPDPLGFVDGFNLYQYAQNNPMVFVDPTGWKSVRDGQGSLGKFEAASEYGIKGYDELKAEIKGTGLEAHHLVEKRFADAIGMNPGNMASIALTPSEHRQFTTAWREATGYSNQNTAITTATATRDNIWSAAQQIYSGYTELLNAAYKDIYG